MNSPRPSLIAICRYGENAVDPVGSRAHLVMDLMLVTVGGDCCRGLIGGWALKIVAGGRLTRRPRIFRVVTTVTVSVLTALVLAPSHASGPAAPSGTAGHAARVSAHAFTPSGDHDLATAAPAELQAHEEDSRASLMNALATAMIDPRESRADSGVSAKPARYTLLHASYGQQKIIRRWNPCQKAVTYRVNLTGVPASRRPDTLRMIREGFTTMTDATAITFRYAGTTRYIPGGNDSRRWPSAEIVVAIISDKATQLDLSNAIGMASVSGSNVDWLRLTDGSWKMQRYAAARGWAVLKSPGINHYPRWGRRAVLLHEIGHVLGLGHAEVPGNVMFPGRKNWGFPELAGLGPGDRAGLKLLGREAGCINITSQNPMYPDLD